MTRSSCSNRFSLYQSSTQLGMHHLLVMRAAAGQHLRRAAVPLFVYAECGVKMPAVQRRDEPTRESRVEMCTLSKTIKGVCHSGLIELKVLIEADALANDFSCALSRLRLSGHNLNVKLLRQQQHRLPCELRICTKCNWHCKQDEGHILLDCPSADLAELHIKHHHLCTLLSGSSRLRDLISQADI